MLERAIEKAKESNVKVDFINADARYLEFNKEFDLALIICEGGFPLMETDEMNFKILQNAAKSLKNKGKLILTTLNGLFPLFHSVRDHINSNSTEEKSTENTFDLMTFRDRSTIEITDDDGNTKIIKYDERYYVPSEITWLLKSLGFKRLEYMGANLGLLVKRSIID